MGKTQTLWKGSDAVGNFRKYGKVETPGKVQKDNLEGFRYCEKVQADTKGRSKKYGKVQTLWEGPETVESFRQTPWEDSDTVERLKQIL